jgi:quercetin dioxygenase-like cupin family protein
MAKAAATSAGKGAINLMLGSITCMTMLAGDDTGGQLSAVDVRCPQGTGPGPHTDPWRESFYVLEGEFEFQVERDGELQPIRARPGDMVSVPAGLGHAFRAMSAEPARLLILSTPGGLDRFFADAGEPAATAIPPRSPANFDRPRFEAATNRYKIGRFAPGVTLPVVTG